ncbi:MAG: DUF4157 domain-containing protein [Kofleriaceae bacterium]
MDRAKAHREDLALDTRAAAAPRQGADVGADHADAHGDAASRLWQRVAGGAAAPERGSADEAELARAGRRDATVELPFREELQPLLGADLSRVPVHAGPNAQAAATQLGAHAYAVDGAIVLGDAAPDKELVAHELVHALQAGAPARGGDPEAEADHAASGLLANRPMQAAELRAGGGGVRKKEKTPTAALRELIESLRVDAYVDGDAPRTIEHGSTTHDDRVEGERTTTEVQRTVDGRRGLQAVEETTVTTGELGHVPRTAAQLAAERKQASAAIESAQGDLHVQIVLASFDQCNESLRATRLDHEAEALGAGNLDPALVAGKQALLRGEAKRARARAAAIEREVELRRRLIKTLDEGLADLAKEDPWRVAQELARAELSFRAKLKVTKKDALGLDLLKGSLGRERARSETAIHDDATSVTTTKGRKTSLETGKGLRAKSEHTDGYNVQDEHGDVVHGDTTTHERSGGLALDQDGSVGVDGASKLTKALENSYGKMVSSVACGGSVTVNVVPLPRASAEAKQRFSVIVTINLSAALALGVSKSKARKHGKGTLNVEGGASLEGALTHTHLLDAEGAEAYLQALEQTGAGDRVAAGKAPEFGLLQLALTGGQSVDDVLGAAAASLGSADAAAAMGIDESVELTLNAGANLEFSAAAEHEGGGLGASTSRGGSIEGFRTLKVARVAGEPGQELVDVTVMFGDKSDQHGALSASAMGVTASAGKKQWSGGEQSVTFRLDAGQDEDYAALYHEIVGTATREGLVALRKSPRYHAHVRSYHEKVEQGGQDTLGIKGALGVATSDSWTRSSSSGKDADGNDTAEEVGSSTSAVGFSVGPLELLRRSQTASATLTARDGTSVLDLAESTDEKGLGGFEVPTMREVLAAESPLKALEDAITENRRTLAGFLLDPEDLLELARRAKDKAAWSRVPLAAKVATLPTDDDYTCWATLRGALMHPELDEQYSLEQIALAREVARGRAIADFMSSLGKAKGVRYLQTVLRDYDQHGGDGADVGVAYEFPAGIKPEAFIDLRFRLKTFERSLSSQTEDEALAHCAELELDTAELLDKLRLAEFTSERSRIEMVRDLRERVIPVAQRRQALQRATAGGPVDEQAAAREDAATLVHHREEEVIASKLSEVTLLWRCEAVLRRDPSSLEINDELGPILGEGGQLDEVFEIHVRQIKALRATYKAAGTPEAQWLCSVDIHDRARDYDVGMDQALRLLWAYYAAQPYRLGEASYEPRKQRWHRKFWAY